jgi:2-polyprenyl-6-methoxyphenol hydroxylase-like FAD-dependent oxidoreductase
MTVGGSVIVVGAGVGGLCAAGALAQAGWSVTLLEKDALAADTLEHKGVVQGAHLHSLLLGALTMLDELFPGFALELSNQGARTLRLGLDQQVFEAGSWMPRRDLGVSLLAQSRGLLEREVRRRVLAQPGVQLLGSRKVSAIEVTHDGDVLVAAMHGAEPETHRAALVVDASGVGGALLQQLESSSGARVPVDRVESRIVYVSTVLEKPAKHENDVENILIVPRPSESRGGALLDIEGNRWVVSLHGRNGVEPPTDHQGWTDYARTLPDERIWTRIEGARQVGKLHVFRKPVSSFRRFDRVTSLPAAYLPVGDVITSVNPIFGQGMALAIGHARLLRHLPSLSPAARQAWYLERACDWSERAWRRATAYDRTFLDGGEAKAAAMTALARARRERAAEDLQAYRQMVLDGQMMPTEVR